MLRSETYLNRNQPLSLSQLRRQESSLLVISENSSDEATIREVIYSISVPRIQQIHSLSQALELLRSEKPSIVLLFTGRAIEVQSVRRVTSATLICLTATQRPEDEINLLFEAGADEVLAKTTAPRVLSKKLRIMIEWSQFHQEPLLSSSRQRFQTFFEQSPIPMMIFKIDGSVTDANLAWAKLFDVSLSDLQEYNIFNDSQLQKLGLQPQLERAFRGEHVEVPPFYYDPRIEARTGRPRWLQVSFFPISNEVDLIAEVAVLEKDVTDQVLATEALGLNEKILRLITSALPVNVAYLDEHLNYQFVNPAYEQFLGVSAKEVLGRNVRDVLQSDLYQDLQFKLEKAIAGNSIEFTVQAKNSIGENRTFEAHWIPDFRDDGSVRGLVSVGIDITENRQREERFRTISERLQALIQASPVAIYVLDSRGIVCMWSPAAEKLYGWKAEDVLGKPVPTIPPDRRPLFQERLARTCKGAPQSGFDSVHMTKDGRRIEVSVWTAPIQDETGDPQCLMIVLDENLRKQNEREIRQSRDLLDIILAGVTDGITVLNKDEKVVYANIVGAHQCGFESVEQIIGQTFERITSDFDYFDEAGNPIDLNEMPCRQSLAGTKEPKQKLIRIVSHQDRSEAWYLSNSKPVFDENGNSQLAINIFRDFTKRKRMEETNLLVASAASLLGASLDWKATLQKLTDLLVPRMADWCVVSLVGSSSQIESIASAEMDSKRFIEIENKIESLSGNGDHWMGTSSVVRTGKSVLLNELPEEIKNLLSYLCVPLRGRKQILGALTFGIVGPRRKFDEDDMKLAEDIATYAALSIENSRLYEHELKVNRVKDEFLATLSHELRTPLNVIQGNAELLRDEFETMESDEKAGVIDSILRNAYLQTQIVSDLLDVSAIITGKVKFQPQIISPREIVQSVVSNLISTANAKNVAMTLNLKRAPDEISADPTRLQQIVWNLISNALKFTGEGGKISISVSTENQMCKIQVKDTGIGISPEFLPFIFDRFRQEDSSLSRGFGGLGLGLAIVRHLTELHGGRVSAQSEGPGQGSCFEVHLPLGHLPHQTSSNVEKVSHEKERKFEIPSIAGTCVLLIEDSADNRLLLKRFLSKAGASVLEAESAEAARQILAKQTPDIILSDIGMPDEDGIEFIKELRASAGLNSKIPAIALSAYVRPEEKLLSLSAGFQSHVGKPTSIPHLLEEILRLLKK